MIRIFETGFKIMRRRIQRPAAVDIPSAMVHVCVWCGETNSNEYLHEKCRDEVETLAQKDGIGIGESLTEYARELRGRSKCNRCNTNPAMTGHSCPYDVELYDIHDTRCSCCPGCEKECAADT